jgi:S-DNA-T family DNA segregation ATPase FtsK/SpoIIIE
MANSLRKKTPPPPDPEKLTADKPAEVTVTEVVKDERTSKIMGAVSLLLTVFLFVSLTSYLFTWQEDQDKVHQFGIKIFATDDVRVTNLLGVLGAYVAHTLIYKGFGLASFLFCTTFFVLGVNLLFGKKIIQPAAQPEICIGGFTRNEYDPFLCHRHQRFFLGRGRGGIADRLVGKMDW